MTTPPNDVKVRIFVNETWVDVTTDVRDDPGIQITTGRQDESDDVNPGSCTLTFDNRDGTYTPRNPVSPFYGYLNRNTPIYVGLNEIVDTYTRTVTAGWGESDTGDDWLAFGNGGSVSATDTFVATGVGTHSVPTTGAYRMNYTDSTSGPATSYNGEVRIAVSTSVATVSGAPIEPGNVLLRLQDTTNYYMIRVTVEVSGAIKIAIYRGNNTIIAAAVTTGYTYAGTGTTIWVRGGAFDSVIYGKAWTGTVDDEPDDWQVSVADTTYGYGYFGVRSGVASGNANTKPITFNYDDLTIWLSQFNGEVVSWPQEYDESGREMIVPVEAAGVLRRIGQRSSPIGTSLRRFYEKLSSPLPGYYAPMEEGDLANEARPSIGSIPFVITSSEVYGVANERHFGQVTIGSWLEPGVKLVGLDVFSNFDFSLLTVAELIPLFLNVPVTTTWAVEWVRVGGRGTADTVSIGGEGASPTASSYTWDVTYNATADTVVVAHDLVTDATLTASDFDHRIYDGGAHLFRLVVTDGGANLTWTLYVDGVQEGTGTVSTASYAQFSNIIDVIIQSLMAADLTLSVGYAHLAIYGSAPPSATLPVTAFRGNTNELADVRFGRLCDEELIVNFVSSTVGDALGPQFDDPLVSQFEEITNTDGGITRELIGARGLHYEPLATLRDRSVTVSLDVDAGHLIPPYVPLDDDLNLVNDVRASKRNGGSYRYELTSGRLGTSDPIDGGVGRYDDTVDANPFSESQLASIAEREVARGTVDVSRFPTVTVDLRSPVIQASVALRRQILNIYVSTRLQLVNMERFNVFEIADLLVIGYTKQLSPYVHRIEYNCAPFDPYRAPILDTSRLDAGASTLSEDLDATETGVDVATSDGTLWTTSAGDFPLDVMIGGERMTVSTITGASSPQTFTVTRSVNGVVKTHATGAEVWLADPTYLG